MRYAPPLPDHLRGTLHLPHSKSLENRALLLYALCGRHTEIMPSSVCDDTWAMWHGLQSREYTVDVKAAGTAMRFLTAYFATLQGEQRRITGSERMLQRPIGPLVDALRQLGAQITYVTQQGFPPLAISGRKLRGGSLQLPANISSQYVSALLMVGPTLSENLEIQLCGPIVSRPYIDMTLAMMKRFGAQANWIDAQTIGVKATPYTAPTRFEIESDWSAASYWFEAIALTPDTEAHLELKTLQRNSLQGDSAVCRLFAPLGVATTFCTDRSSIVLTKDGSQTLPEGVCYEHDLTHCPDLAQALVVTCALQRRPFCFTGLESLRIKETDRIKALQCELMKLGFNLQTEGNHSLYIHTYNDQRAALSHPHIATYNDHRMAMAFAPAAWRFRDLTIENPEVVSKSYPHYWKDLQSL